MDVCARVGDSKALIPFSVCVCMGSGDKPWLTHMAAICEAALVVKLGGEKVLREREICEGNARSEGKSGMSRSTIAGMYLPCFIDGLMFWKT